MVVGDHIIASNPAGKTLPGRYLFEAGNAFGAQSNQSVKRLPYAFAHYVEQIDIIGHANFYEGPPASAPHRLIAGLRQIARQRVTMTQEGNIRTIKVRRLHLPQPLDMLIQAFWIYVCLRPVLKERYEVAVVSAPDNVLLAKLLKRAGCIRHLIYYDADYFPAYVDPRWSRVADWQERRYMRTADGVASVSRALASLRQQQGARRSVVVGNGVDFDRFNAAPAQRLPHPPTLIYTGTLDLRWGVDLGIRALSHLRERLPDARYLIVGDGPARPVLEELAASLQLSDHVQFTGWVDYEALPALLAQADIGLATSRPNAFRQYASPMKVVEYMAAGLPVIGSGGGEPECMINEAGAGVHTTPDPESIAETAHAMLTAPETWHTFSQAGIRYARARSWEQQGMRLAEFVAEFVNQTEVK